MRTRPRIRAAALAAVMAAVLLGPACGKPSDEARVRKVLDRAVSLAEKRDTAALMELFAPDYRDFQGRDIDGTLRLVNAYLDRYQGIVLHLLAARIGEPGPDGRVAVDCEIVMSHGAAEVLRKLIRVSGEYYRFHLELRRTEPAEWRFVTAEWESIGLDELLPESLEILRKLFPGI